MERAKLTKCSDNVVTLDTNFYGAAVITASGQEIPITEKMLQSSFEVLIDAWEKTRIKKT